MAREQPSSEQDQKEWEGYALFEEKEDSIRELHLAKGDI
jgi:hypothetical protein